MSGMPETKRHIVIVEDEPAIADTLRFALEREGFGVTWCQLARDAADPITRGATLVILDVGLPDESGFEFLKRLRRTLDVPVLLLTARAEEVDRILGLELGADDYVVKPFSPREVVARVRAIIKRTAHDVRNQATNLDHDEAGRRFLFLGKVLALTAAEYRILAVLANAPGRVYSRSQLLDAIGSDSADAILERTVDSHVKAIRGKLRAVSVEHDPIETHRGFGYSLRAGG